MGTSVPFPFCSGITTGNSDAQAFGEKCFGTDLCCWLVELTAMQSQSCTDLGDLHRSKRCVLSPNAVPINASCGGRLGHWEHRGLGGTSDGQDRAAGCSPLCLLQIPWGQLGNKGIAVTCMELRVMTAEQNVLCVVTNRAWEAEFMA